MNPRVIVLRAAGSNCDHETKTAFDFAGGQADLVHINRLLENPGILKDYQILAIPGGFTYGDDVSAGKILANELRYKLTDALQTFHSQKKLIIGICNGFQVLVKAGLLPEMNFQQSVTLTINDSGKFEDRWVYLNVNESSCVFTNNFKSLVYYPVAHAEGKFIVSDHKLLKTLNQNNQIVFQYTGVNGKSKVTYPENPNGSVEDIAGICDTSGRILGMMPHPERHMDPTHHPQWTRKGLATEGDGVQLFRNAIKYYMN